MGILFIGFYRDFIGFSGISWYFTGINIGIYVDFDG
jgi:hypothetical protein